MTLDQLNDILNRIKRLENRVKVLEGEKTKRFIPPTVQEVRDYCKERGNSVDPVAFFNFYESKNWMVGKTKMSKWKACIVTWEKRPTAVQTEITGRNEKCDLDKIGVVSPTATPMPEELKNRLLKNKIGKE
jgi:hypothetical protein